MKQLFLFLKTASEDPRIGPIHISLYAALIGLWEQKNKENPLTIFSKDIMSLCKISGVATYHRSIRELHQYGYIKYVPSYNHFIGSLVYLFL